MPKRPTYSAIVLAGALALTGAATAVVHLVERESDRVEFEADARELHQRMEARLQTLVALLRGAAALHVTLDTRNFRAFETYIRRLDLERNYPGVLGIGFASHVTRDELDAFERTVRAERPGFRIHPEPEAEDAWVIRMLEPMNARNAVAIGFDMGSEATRRAAMERAVLEAEPALTDRVTLVQEITPDKQAGFLVYVPVYDDAATPPRGERLSNALGVSYAPLRAGDFFAPLTGPRQPAFEVYTSGVHGPEELLYRSAPRPADGLHQSFPMEGLATDWIVHYRQPRRDTGGILLTVAGLGLLLSISLYFATSAAERRRIEQALLHRRDAAVARAVARLSEAPTEPLPMVERLAEWLVGEGLALGVEARRGDEVVLRRGSEMDADARQWRCAQLTIRITPRDEERDTWIERVLEQAGWLVERAALHARARRALARNEEALRFAELFVGVLGHDLRNPLSAIKSAILLLQHRSPEPADAEILRRASTSVDRMTRLIDQILDFTRARIGGGIPIRAVPSEVAKLTSDIVDEAMAVAPEHHEIVCSSSGDTTAHLDPDRFAQALSNLLGNAVQHGDAGQITVVVDGEPEEAVEVTVQNPGVVPPEVLPAVFEPFRGSDGGQQRLGLGMYITRMIVEAHGGTIGMESAADRGTIVRIRLPREPQTSAPDRS